MTIVGAIVTTVNVVMALATAPNGAVVYSMNDNFNYGSEITVSKIDTNRFKMEEELNKEALNDTGNGGTYYSMTAEAECDAKAAFDYFWRYGL